jgi:hypothetical protein
MKVALAQLRDFDPVHALVFRAVPVSHPSLERAFALALERLVGSRAVGGNRRRRRALAGFDRTGRAMQPLKALLGQQQRQALLDIDRIVDVQRAQVDLERLGPTGLPVARCFLERPVADSFRQLTVPIAGSTFVTVTCVI